MDTTNPLQMKKFDCSYGGSGLGQTSEAISTRGAGQGVVVFFGMAKPVKTPLIGTPRQP